MRTILHIIPHFGGGAGVVLTALIDGIEKYGDWEQEVVCFEYLNSFGKEWSKNNGIVVHEEINPEDLWLHEKVSQTDITHLHFWNHPATYYFMYTFSGKRARMIFWAHANGHHVPYLFNDAVLNFPEIFTIASDYSLKTDIIAKRTEEWKRNHLRMVFSCSGTKGLENIIPKPHNGFNIGYIGTVDYCKMHRNFIDLCARVNIPDVKFIVCGGPSHLEMQREAKEKGVADIFDFRGQVQDIGDVLSELDLFAYPLNADNYGTGEQVLIEAMSAGIPQVTLDNGPEAYVIKDGLTGIIAKNEKLFIESIEKLYKDKDTRKLMAKASKKYAAENYDIVMVVNNWLTVYEKLSGRNKRECIFNNIDYTNMLKEDVPFLLFITALGDRRLVQIYEKAISYYPGKLPKNVKEEMNSFPDILNSQTRGSIKHYNSFFKNEKLAYLRN